MFESFDKQGSGVQSQDQIREAREKALVDVENEIKIIPTVDGLLDRADQVAAKLKIDDDEEMRHQFAIIKKFTDEAKRRLSTVEDSEDKARLEDRLDMLTS